MDQKEALIVSLRKEYGIDFNAMIEDIKRYIPTFNEKKFQEAFIYAARSHEGQFRRENKPYIVHPIETARILVSLHADEDALIAALLHDVPEDTPHTIREIEEKFGKKIAFLVNGITKLSKVHFRNNMAVRQIESLKKLFIFTAEDPRIILIKLADRLHNMRTLQYIDKEEKRLRIARETLEIFVPVANLLGIEELKCELEDLCFRYLMPDQYENISDRMQRNREKNQHILDEMIHLVTKELEKDNLKATVYGRQKNVYTIYKKIVSQGKRLDEMDDYIALRILVPEREDCYKTLGIIHTLFKPKPGKFKDYIAVPKVNGYQSLHTTVFGLNGITAEFQIRTNQMHLEAEYGIASHYFEHQSRTHSHLEADKRSHWITKIREIEKERRGKETFLEDLKYDIFQDRIFVFTPKGDPIDLPKDATCIDFAYAIHTQVGHRALKADVNGEIVPMTTTLNTGNTVRIIVADKPKGPNREWLFFAKTNSARNKMREYFQKESREAKIHSGRQLLQKEFDRAGVGLLKNISSKKVEQFAVEFPTLGLKTFDDIMIAIGEGSLSTIDVMNFLFPQKESYWKSLPVWFTKFFPRRYAREPRTLVGVKTIFSEDRPNQLRSLLDVISKFEVNIVKTEGYISWLRKVFVCKLTLDIKNFQQLSEICENFEHIQGVERVERQFWQRKLVFLILSTLTFCLWAIHPFILYFIKTDMPFANNPLLSDIFQYFSLFMLFFMVFFLKRLTHRSFPELRETNYLWIMTFILSIFALVTFFTEVFLFKLHVNWIVASAIILIILSYLTLEYVDYRNKYL